MKKSEVKVGMKVIWRGVEHVVTRLDCRPGNVAIIEPEYVTESQLLEWAKPSKEFRFIPGRAVPAADLTLA